MRGPTKPIRIDAVSHMELRHLAVLYTARWERHVSIADIVRMGITLLNEKASQPRERREDSECSKRP